MKKESVVLVVVLAALVAFAAGRMSTSVKQAPNAAAPTAVASAEGTPEAAPAAAAPAANGDWLPATLPAKGNPAALVTILEISDFQCPFCSRVGPTMKKLLEEYPNDVRVVWANQPLPFHDRAKPAAVAAMAAHRQGKFWEMHDKMFAAQSDLTDDNFKKWAGEIGLDAAKWEQDKGDAALGQQIDREMAASNATGARGTPSFFINGKLVQGAQPFEEFKKEVDEALTAAKALAAAGKAGLDLAEAAAVARNSDNGAKIVTFFLKGETPPAEAPAAPREEAHADNGPATPPPDSLEIWKVPVDKRDFVRGDSGKALVTVVEFSDFQCPFCSRGANAVTEVEKLYGDKVRVVFKHTPLPFHEQARPAHLASIAAGRQGKFWEFHDKAFANQQGLTEENFAAWAKELGLDAAKFDKDRKDPAANQQMEDDMALGQSVGIRGTPGFMINGRKLVGAQPVAMFKAYIDEELKKAEGSTKKGAAYYDEVVGKGKVWSELNATVADFDLKDLPFKGPADAPVTIIEFSDFQCPFCSRISDPVNTVFAKYGGDKGKVKVVFAHFPLGFHQMARPASTAAQVAWEQGGKDLFFKVHDALFAAQRELSEEKIAQVAKDAGVDMDKLKAAKADPKYGALFDRVMEMGSKGGVEGTPSIFINNRKWEPAGGYSPESFSSVIDKVLAKKI
ncbi:MAG: thioredoxin, partial [Myxococcales bacterium]|nr:thioredoxin [Myxococcales bacterium]